MDEAMEHGGLLLEILPKPKKQKGIDEEAQGSDPRPGDSRFSIYMQQKMLDFYSKRGSVLRAWAEAKDLSQDQFDAAKTAPPDGLNYTPDENKHRMYPLGFLKSSIICSQCLNKIVCLAHY
jgi:hypothetical protein